MSLVLEVEHLTKTFGSPGREDYTAVNDVSFSVNSGEKLAIIGESGSGKTTVVNMITRLLDATSGTIRLDGEDITFKKGRELKDIYKKMQMVFQTPTESFNPRRTLGDGIAESLLNHGEKKKKALEEAGHLLELCGLEREFAKRYPYEVSGGQCQRAAIARALAVEPEVLLMDEPTSALDPISTSKIEDLALELKKDYTIVMVTHNMQQAVRISDNTAFFLLGEVVEYNETEKLFSIPSDKRTEDYITGRFG